MPLTINILLSAGSVLVLIVLALLHLLAGWYFYKRLRNGHNGVTLALLIQMLATAQMLAISVVVVIYAAYQSPAAYRTLVQSVVFVSRFLVLLSIINLVVVARIEAHKPLRRQTSTQRKIYKLLNNE